MINYLKNIKFFIIRLFIAIIILVAGMYFSVTNTSFSTKYNKIKDFSNVKAIEVQKGDILTQYITFDMEELRNIGVAAVNRTNNCSGDITLTLSDNTGVLWEKNVSIKKLGLGKAVWFDVKQSVEIDKQYSFKISADNIEGKLHIAGIVKEENSQGITDNVIKNGSQEEISLVLETAFGTRLHAKIRILIAVWTIVTAILIIGFEFLFKNKCRTIITLFLIFDLFAISSFYWYGLGFSESLNYLLFVGIILSFVIAVLLYIVLNYKKCEKVELYFVISSLIFGIIYSLILPPFSAPDEDHHFTEAYRLSNFMMNQSISDENGYIYMRECDIQNYEKYPDNIYTINYIKNIIRGDSNLSEKIAASEIKRNDNAAIALYLPQATGITIGRLLHFNYERTVFLGRFINLLSFIFITVFAIKIMPYGKWIIFAICQIPILMEVVSSYSYDALTLSIIFLFIACLLKIYNQKKQLSIKQKILFGILVFLFGLLKPVYVPLIAIVLLIPNENVAKDRLKSYGYKAAILIIAMISCVLLQKFSLMSMKMIENEINPSNSSSVISDETMKLEIQEVYQIQNLDPKLLPTKKFLIENPFDFFESAMASFIAFFDEYVLSLFGNYLGWYHIRIPVYISVMAMVLLYYSCIISNSEDIKCLNIKSKMWIIFLTIGCCFAVFFSMYMKNTSPSEVYIIGVQGRYIMPLLGTLPFLLTGKSKKSETTKVNILMLSLTVQILAILSVCRYIWS